MEIFRDGNCSVTAPQIHKKKFFSLPKSCICLPPVILYKSVKSPFSGLTIFRKFKKTYREGEKNMPYCPNCGQQIDGTMRFCPGCGAALGGVNSTTSANTAYTGTVNQSANDYRLVLVSPGSCKTATVREILHDVLGYSTADAATLSAQVPVEIAHSLSFQQALDLARMLTEYGMQVAVYNTNGYVDLSPYATSSVFDSDGSVLPTVAVTLASLGIANQVREFLRWSRPNPFSFLFAPRYHRPAPPPPPRHHIRRPPPPSPPPRHPGIFGGSPPGRGPGPMGGRGPGGPHGSGGPGGHGPHGPGGRR